MSENIKIYKKTERSPLRGLWQTEKTGQRVRRYQTEHRQHFTAAKRTGTGKRKRTWGVALFILV